MILIKKFLIWRNSVLNQINNNKNLNSNITKLIKIKFKFQKKSNKNKIFKYNKKHIFNLCSMILIFYNKI